MRRFWAACALALAIVSHAAAQRPQSAPPSDAPALPPLPSLAIDAFPAAARNALTAVDRAARAAPGDANAVGTLARTLHAWELWDAAHAAYARAAALAPRTFDWHYLDAVVLLRLARPQEALPVLERALSLEPGSLPARIKLADARFDTGDDEASGGLYQALAQEPSTAPIGELGLGRLAARAGRHQAAVTHFERAIALFPQFGGAHYGAALSYRALGRVDEARAALTLHHAFGARWPRVDDPALASVTALRGDARAEAARGLKLAEQGDLEGAIAATEAALALDATLVQARANLISLYGRTGNWARAEASYRLVVSAGLHLDEAHYNYGVVLGLQDRWTEAEAAYRAAIGVNPLHASARNNLGQLLERGRHYADAEREYREACAAQPTFRLARFNLARVLIAQGQANTAIGELEGLRTPVDAETPRYVFALGVAYVRAGRRDEGVKWATEARRLANQFGQVELVQAIDRNLAELGRP